jgi:hypothetical protein
MGFPGPPRPDGNIFGHPANIILLLFPGECRQILSAILIPFKKFIKQE